MELGVLDKIAFRKVSDNAPDSVMSYKSYRQLMAWQFHINGANGKKLLACFKENGLIEMGVRGFKIVGVLND